MSAPEIRDAEALFYEALEIPPSDRPAFLDQKCGSDAPFRTEVEELLRSHDAAGGFLSVDAPASPAIEEQFARLKPEEAGERIGNYKLLQQIGEGGFGVVWMAEQERPVRRRVALKIIKLGMDTKEVIARFEQERQALAMMDHPNIAKVFDAGATPFGRPFFAMELVKGVKITDYCDQAKLPTTDRLALFVQVCNAIQHAHQKGIIHRDLKPSNILVTLHDGIPVPKVIDFGVAKATQQQRLTDLTLFTQFEQMVGTPLYMSPEQAELSGLDIDTRSDIYSLGVLLYELLTGRTPFDPAELMRQGLDEIRRVIREEEPQKPSTFVSTMALDLRTNVAQHRQTDSAKLTGQIRGDLDWIVMKALEKDRNRRYETANGLARDIERHLASEPVQARPPTQIYRFRKYVRRHRVAVATTAAIFLTLVPGIVTTTREALRALSAERLAETRLEEVAMQKNALRDQLRAMSRADEVIADTYLRQRDWAVGLAYLARANKSDPENAQAQEHLLSTLVNGAGERDPLPCFILQHGDGVHSASFSADGTRVVTASEDHTARVWDAATGQAVGTALRHGDAVQSARFSVDGTRVVTASRDKTARIWSTATGEPIGPALRHDEAVLSASFNADGIRVLTVSGNVARVWNATRGEPVTAPLKHDAPLTAAVFSPDGAFVVTASEDKTARLWDAATGQPVGEPLRHEDIVWDANFTSDSAVVVTVSADGTARTWNVAALPAAAARLAHGHDRVWSGTFSADGTRLLTTAHQEATIWDVSKQLPVGAAMRHSAEVRGAAFSFDGTRVITASADATARIWDASTGEALGPPLRHEAKVTSASFSPDGTRVVTASWDNTARVWNAATPPLGGTPLQHIETVRTVVFSPDGSRVLTSSLDSTARVWDSASGAPLTPPLRHKGMVLMASFNRDATRVLTASGDRTVQIWDATTGRRVGEPLLHSVRVRWASFSPDGARIVTAGDQPSGHLWVAATSQPIGSPLRHSANLTSAEFSPDSMRVVTTSEDRTARLWLAATGEPACEPLMHGATVNSATFSPDGARVLTASDDKTARLWDVRSGHPIGEPLRHDAEVRYATFSPDGRLIATASLDRRARIWDAVTGQLKGEPLLHDSAVLDVRFSSDGTRVVTASKDQSARVWSVASSRATHTLLPPAASALTHACFSPDGRRVVTAGADFAARIWDVASGKTFELGALHDLIGVIGGLSFSPQGLLQQAPTRDRFAMRDRLRAVSTPDPDANRTLQWLLTPPEQRTISPQSTATSRDIADRAIASGVRGAIRDILRYDPGHPLLQIALAPHEDDPMRAEFLRRYGIAHLPANPKLIVHAAEMLFAQKQPLLATPLVERAAELDPTPAATLQPHLDRIAAAARAAQSPTAPRKFRFHLDDDKDPGYRECTRDGEVWEAREPSGKADRFEIVRRAEVDGRPGTILLRNGRANPEFFISDRDVADPRIYMREDGGEWTFVAKMEDVE